MILARIRPARRRAGSDAALVVAHRRDLALRERFSEQPMRRGADPEPSALWVVIYA
jgi:hypothetical protein